MSQETTRLRDYLESNPKWIGILFGAMVLLSQIGTVSAGAGATTLGP